MRAPFDRLIDVYWGVSERPTRCARALAVPARYITDDAFFDQGEPFNDQTGYVTADAVSFFPPEMTDTSGGEVTLDFGFADLIAITAGGPITHQVYRAELRVWPTGTNYYRAYLGPIRGALPAPCSDGYAEEYTYGFGAPGTAVVARTSATTWTDGTWTLTAEVEPGITCSCVSHWTFSDGTNTWETDYNGSAAPGLFAAIAPATPPFVWVYPV